MALAETLSSGRGDGTRVITLDDFRSAAKHGVLLAPCGTGAAAERIAHPPLKQSSQATHETTNIASGNYAIGNCEGGDSDIESNGAANGSAEHRNGPELGSAPSILRLAASVARYNSRIMPLNDITYSTVVEVSRGPTCRDPPQVVLETFVQECIIRKVVRICQTFFSPMNPSRCIPVRRRPPEPWDFPTAIRHHGMQGRRDGCLENSGRCGL